MMQTIQGEAPFQVLASNFSIGPTASGYTLQISADGKNYSNLFSVGADVTRLVTNVANGSYYRLSGNVGKAVVNWRTQCNDGEGGGSGSGSTVSVTQVLSAGTKVATITVDGNGTDIFAPEGGEGGGDYKVVSELPESAETGQLFYVPEHSGTSTLSGWEIYDIADNTLVGSVVVGFEEEGDIYEVFIDVETGEGGNFTLNGDQIGTSNTFREMGSFDNRVDLIAKCDGEGHCWIYLITPGDERRFDFTPEEETATIEDSTYDYPEIVPAATYRYLNGQFELIPEGSLVHLQTLSGVTGATYMLYECDGQLFLWNENSGATGIWNDDMELIADGNNKDHYYMGLSFSTIPENTVLMSGITHPIYSGEKWNIEYINTDEGKFLYVKTVEGLGKKIIAVGETWSGSPTYSLEVWITFQPHYIGIACYGTFKAASAWDGTANGAHWELVNKETWPYTPKDYDGIMSPDKKGRIHHKKSELRTKDIKLNGGTIGTFYTNGNTSATNIYAPTTGGTAGQVLTSNGDNAPTWATMIKAVKITSAEYEALVQAGTTDPNTLYLIDDE